MEDLASRIEERRKQLSETFTSNERIQRNRGLDLVQRITSYCSSRELLEGAVPPLDEQEREWSDFWYNNSFEKHCYFGSRIYSAYSRQYWDTIIYQNIITFEIDHLPNKLSILCDIRNDDDMHHPYFICYVRLQHCLLIQVNSFLCQSFWPGINIKESLSCPEYSIIALYGRLVVGAGFITPGGYITYLAVHPDWRGSDIGKQMLFYLVKISNGQDITMHVSATNTAMMLYQRFGFKIEEFILHFYDKYYPSDDTIHCKHALFLRLRQTKKQYI